MKATQFSNRAYLLVGDFEAKYHGDKTDDSKSISITDFSISPYDACLNDAYAIDASFLSFIVDPNTYQELSLSGPLKIYRKDNHQAYLITPDDTLRIYQPKLSDISQQGTTVYGTLSGLATLHLKENKMAFSPISIPVFQMTGTFPGFQDAPIKTNTAKKKREPIDFKGLFEVLSLLFSVLMVFILTYAIFSAIHPIVLLVLAGSVTLIVVMKAIPSRLALPIYNILQKLATIIFYAGGVLLFLGLGIALLGNLTAFFFFWIPLVAFIFLIDYLTKSSWLILRNASLLAIVVCALSIPVLLSTFTGGANPSVKSYDPVPRTAQITPVKNAEVETKQPDTISQQISHTISWQDFDNLPHKITYTIGKSDNRASQLKRENVNISVQNYNDFAFLFSRILENESLQIESFIVQLDSIRRSLDLTEIDFAKLMVSLVQQIDYSLLNENDCPATTALPCQEKVRYGVYCPTEFLYSLEGDCDTKSLLLYLLFDEFDYEVALLGSLPYQHSMIALKIPGNGVAVTIQNQSYYVWEITSPGWELGIMPPENNLLQFWEPILINNQNQLQ